MEEERQHDGHEEEASTGYDYPVRMVTVNYSISEEGGGVEILIRADGEPLSEILKAMLQLYKEINGKAEARISSAKGYC
ncbi:hypothetical protein [Geoglobus sp.]